jgi:hypothetical protein
MKTPHIHAELIKQWADGAEIEHLSVPTQMWMYTSRPAWNPENQYRIKPEPKSDFSVFRWVYSDGSTDSYSKSNVRFTFDGESGDLKSAEVL